MATTAFSGTFQIQRMIEEGKCLPSGLLHDGEKVPEEDTIGSLGGEEPTYLTSGGERML